MTATRATRHNRDSSANTTEARRVVQSGEQSVMLSTDANKPMGKPGQRNRKKKSTQRTKSGQQQATAQETGIDPVRDAQAETSRESIQEVVHEIGQEIGKEASHDVSAPGASTEGTPGEASAMDA